MKHSLGRRAVLAALASAPLAGCALPGDQRATPTPTPEPVVLPYASDDPAENLDRARGFAIQNRTGEEHFVTVAVDAPERTLFVESRTLDPWAVFRTGDLVRKRGVYRVVIETGAGDRAVHGWVVWPGIEGFDAVVGDAGLRTAQSVFCGPDCRPVSVRGEHVELPYRAPDAPTTVRTAALVVRNTSPTQTRVGIGVRDGETPVLDYEYAVPPGVGVQLPVTRTPGMFDLRVSTDDDVFTAEWHVPEEQRLHLDVDATGITPDCGDAEPGLSVERLRNRDTTSHRVRIELAADGERVAAVTREIDRLGGEGVSEYDDGLPATADAAGRYDLQVVVDDEHDLAATWTVCPPGAPLTVEIDEGGQPRLYSLTRGVIRV